MAAERDLTISDTLVLPARLFSLRFSRSGGPGGQNVNKVETKVDLRLDLDGAAEFLAEWALERLRQQNANRLDAEGRIQITASEHREQSQNIEAAYRRMKTLIEAALSRPRRRRPTRPTRTSVEKRIKEKKRRSEIKKWRSTSDE